MPPPFRILALCYKKDAARNIQNRVQQRCQQHCSYRFEAKTIDAFLLSIIKRFAINLPKWLHIKNDFEVITKFDITNYASEKNLQHLQYPNKYRQTLEILDECKLDEVTKNLYIHAAEQNVFDYDMCHTMAYYIIKHNRTLRTILSSTYQYIFLDELQDMSKRHYPILELLFNNKENNVTAVGDSDQTIMLWAGAMPDIFTTFENTFQATVYKLYCNYRSTPTIVHFINQCIQNLTTSNTKIGYSSAKKENANSFIQAHSFLKQTDETKFIAEQINNIKEMYNLGFEDFAIILKQKTSEYLTATKQEFTTNKITIRNEDEIICTGGISFYDLMEDPFSKLIIYLLKLHERILPLEEQRELDSLLATIFELDFEKSRDLHRLHTIKQNCIKDTFTNAKSWIEIILQYIPKEKIRNKLYKENLFEKATISIENLLQESFDSTNGNLALTIYEYLGINYVKLMTIHKSKGLEFDTIFFADFKQDSWWALDNAKDKQEAKNCFFVGLSRAKERLFFTNPTNNWHNDIRDIFNNTEITVTIHNNTT